MEEAARPAAQSGTRAVGGAESAPVALSDVGVAIAPPHSTGMRGLDELLGGGLAPGAAVLLGGAPGIGKSTLFLQVAGHMARTGLRAVYVSGEESLAQLKGRAQRLDALSDNLLAVATSRADDAAQAIEDGADLLVLDSVQTLASPLAEGLPGSVSQVRAVATQLIEQAKRRGCALVLVGHITKDGQIAGPMLLEHMVDAVLSMEGDRRQLFRLLRVLKNRFGPNQDVLVLRMAGQGLEVVDDPSTLFLGDRDPSLSGAAVVMAMDGQRPFAVEVQALASRSFLSIPRRTGLGFDTNRLHLLLAVLEKRLKLNLGQFDIYAKLGGGLRLDDPGLDAGLVAAVLSSFFDTPLPERAVVWGEVDLNGQIRPVAGQEQRMAQARRLGYAPILCPPDRDAGAGVPTLAALSQRLFGRASA